MQRAFADALFARDYAAGFEQLARREDPKDGAAGVPRDDRHAGVAGFGHPERDGAKGLVGVGDDGLCLEETGERDAGIVEVRELQLGAGDDAAEGTGCIKGRKETLPRGGKRRFRRGGANGEPSGKDERRGEHDLMSEHKLEGVKAVLAVKVVAAASHFFGEDRPFHDDDSQGVGAEGGDKQG